MTRDWFKLVEDGGGGGFDKMSELVDVPEFGARKSVNMKLGKNAEEK